MQRCRNGRQWMTNVCHLTHFRGSEVRIKHDSGGRAILSQRIEIARSRHQDLDRGQPRQGRAKPSMDRAQSSLRPSATEHGPSATDSGSERDMKPNRRTPRSPSRNRVWLQAQVWIQAQPSLDPSATESGSKRAMKPNRRTTAITGSRDSIVNFKVARIRDFGSSHCYVAVVIIRPRLKGPATRRVLQNSNLDLEGWFQHAILFYH